MAAMNDETIAELLEGVLTKRGWSGRRFAQEAQRRGHAVKEATINNVRIGRYPTVSEKTINAIIDVSGLDDDRVRRAARVQPVDRTTETALVSLSHELTPQEQREALRMYREYVRTIKRLRESEDFQPNDRSP